MTCPICGGPSMNRKPTPAERRALASFVGAIRYIRRGSSPPGHMDLNAPFVPGNGRGGRSTASQ